jgi:hypothetical protein
MFTSTLGVRTLSPALQDLCFDPLVRIRVVPAVQGARQRRLATAGQADERGVAA